jgi:hypothetical protein
MRILALDLARRMGVADGDSRWLGRSGYAPGVEAVTLRGTSAEKRARFLGEWLGIRLAADKQYDLIVTESPMNPAASKSDNATIDQLYYHGALQGLAGTYGVVVETAPVMAVRKHFCGVACAPPVRGRKRTAKEAAEARKFINEAVLKRAILLGYLPAGSTDWDQANACALWDFACAKFARALPNELVMFGERA